MSNIKSLYIVIRELFYLYPSLWTRKIYRGKGRESWREIMTQWKDANHWLVPGLVTKHRSTPTFLLHITGTSALIYIIIISQHLLQCQNIFFCLTVMCCLQQQIMNLQLLKPLYLKFTSRRKRPLRMSNRQPTAVVITKEVLVIQNWKK